MTVRAMLRKIREERGLTQVELANKLGISQSTLARFESNSKNPSLPLAIQIADTLDCSLDVLTGRKVS